MMARWEDFPNTQSPWCPCPQHIIARGVRIPSTQPPVSTSADFCCANAISCYSSVTVNKPPQQQNEDPPQTLLKGAASFTKSLAMTPSVALRACHLYFCTAPVTCPSCMPTTNRVADRHAVDATHRHGIAVTHGRLSLTRRVWRGVHGEACMARRPWRGMDSVSRYPWTSSISNTTTTTNNNTTNNNTNTTKLFPLCRSTRMGSRAQHVSMTS